MESGRPEAAVAATSRSNTRPHAAFARRRLRVDAAVRAGNLGVDGECLERRLDPLEVLLPAGALGRLERELVTLLEARIGEDETLLAEIGRG